MSEYAGFDVTVGDHELELRPDNTVIVLFRNEQEVDYMAVDLEDEDANTLRVFNNPEFVRWIGGIALKNLGEPTNEITSESIRRDFNGVQMTFREVVSTKGLPWNPPVVIKEHPSEIEMDMFLELNMDDLSSGLEEILGD